MELVGVKDANPNCWRKLQSVCSYISMIDVLYVMIGATAVYYLLSVAFQINCPVKKQN